MERRWANRFGQLDWKDTAELVATGLYGLARNTEEMEHALQSADSLRCRTDLPEIALELANTLLAFVESTKD